MGVCLVAEVHLARCDECGLEAPLVAHHDVPRDWVLVSLSTGGEAGVVVVSTFHAWSCAATYAAAKAGGKKTKP